jgi:rod shape-determining protein MreD
MHRISLTSAIFLILSAGLIQATSFDLIMLFGVKPDVLFIITVFAALSLYRNDVLKCAAISGIVKDVTSSAVFGSYTLSFILIGLFIYAHQNKFYKEKPFTQMALSFSAYIFMGVCVLLLNLVACRQSGVFYNGLSLILKGALYTCLIAPLVFLIASKALRIKPAQAF